MDPLILVLFGIGGIGFYVLFKKSENTRRESLAKCLGLSVDSSLLGAGGLSGRYEGIPVRVEEFHRGDGQHSQTFTLVKADLLARLPDGLKIVHESDLAQLGKIFGLQDIVIRHARLDRLAVIKAKDPDEARAFLSRPGIADALADFMERYDSAKLSNGTVEVERLGSMDIYAPTVLDAMADLVQVLTGETEYRDEVETWQDAGFEADFANAGHVVKAALARRKREGHGAKAPFDREISQAQPVQRRDDRRDEPVAKFGPSEPTDSPGDGTW